MTTEKNIAENKNAIAALVKEMLTESHENMIANIDKVLESGAIDITGWSPDKIPTITPKTIILALLEAEKRRYSPAGTTYAKSIQANVKNILYFI